MEAQEIELIKPVEEEPEPELEPEPKIAPAPVQQPPRPRPRPVAQPVVYRQPMRTAPVVVERRPIVEPVEEIDPMARWLAQASRGYSVSSLEKVPYRSATRSSFNTTPTNEPNQEIESQNLPSVAVVPSSTQERESRLVTSPDNDRGELYAQSRWQQIREQKTLLGDEQLKERLNRGQTILAERRQVIAKTNSRKSPPPPRQVVNPQTIATTEVAQVTAQRETVRHRLLDIGSYAEADLADSIAWTQSESSSNRKYILYLRAGFKNSGGIEVLPPKTRVIARITKVSRAGLFSMEVTHIIQSFESPKIVVPPGTLEIVSENGSPLKAEIKQKGSSDFWTSAGAIIAPGIEKAMDSVADSAESVLLNDGDRSIISTNGDSNPLASGISGVAEGASNVLSNRMRSRSNRNSIAPYFQFDGDQTVRIRVNEDFILP